MCPMFKLTIPLIPVVPFATSVPTVGPPVIVIAPVVVVAVPSKLILPAVA